MMESTLNWSHKSPVIYSLGLGFTEGWQWKRFSRLIHNKPKSWLICLLSNVGIKKLW